MASLIGGFLLAAGAGVGCGSPATLMDGGAADGPAEADAEAGGAAACTSLYAAAVAEMTGCGCASAFDADPACTPPSALADDQTGCLDGESPNGCAQRLYDEAPAAVGFRDWDATATRKHVGVYLPRCADGGDDCPGQEVRCYDGTRPAVYAQKAHGSGHAPISSNTWIISLGGEGGPCSGEVTADNLDSCWHNYYLGTAGGPFRESLTTRSPWAGAPAAQELEDGILEDTPTINGRDNPFHRANRLRFERCSEWASDGESIIQPAGAGVATHPGATTIYHHGERIAVALFASLTTAGGRDLGAGAAGTPPDGDADDLEDLPSLADADLILLTGSSDGAKWLTVAADRLAAELAVIAPGADVRVVIDSTLTPLLENEYRAQYAFDSGRDGNGTGINDIYDHITDNPDGLRLPQATADDTAYGMTTYQPGGQMREELDALRVPLDESCAAAHAADVSICYDHGHVAVNHLATPYMLIGDLTDHVANHSAWGGTLAPWADAEMEPRMRAQFADVVTGAAAHAGCGDASAAGYTPPVWMPNRHDHTQVLHGDRVAAPMYLCDAAQQVQQIVDLAGALAAWLAGTATADAIVQYTRPDGLTWYDQAACTD